MKFTKIIALILASLFVVLAFAGCGSDAKTDNNEKKEVEEKKEEKKEEETLTTIAISIVDNDGNVLLDNPKLEIDPEFDGTDDGKLYIANVLERAFDEAGNGFTFEFKGEKEDLLQINNLESFNDIKEKEFLVPVEKEETEETEDEDAEPEYETITKNCLVYWNLFINEKEASNGLRNTEIKINDVVKLVYVVEEYKG